MPSYSSLYSNPHSPIPNPKSQISKMECPVGHFIPNWIFCLLGLKLLTCSIVAAILNLHYIMCTTVVVLLFAILLLEYCYFNEVIPPLFVSFCQILCVFLFRFFGQYWKKFFKEIKIYLTTHK